MGWWRGRATINYANGWVMSLIIARPEYGLPPSAPCWLPLGASCVSPVGVYALVKGNKVRIRAVLGSLSGETPIVVDRIVTTTEVAASGASIGAELREQSNRIWNQPMVSGGHYAEEGGGIS